MLPRRDRTSLLGRSLDLALAGVSLLVAVFLAEGAVRWSTTRYRNAAETFTTADPFRLWRPMPNTVQYLEHADSSRPFPLITNNLGLRHPRDLALDRLEPSTRIGLFGDSYLAQLGLPSPYLFPLPLEYLLNASAARFEVLNFGVSSYGVDQSYRTYLATPLRDHLDVVVYFFCFNDINNIYETGLYDLAEDGSLVSLTADLVPWWLSLLSRLHLTYFVLERLGGFESLARWKERQERELVTAQQKRTSDDRDRSIFQGFHTEERENRELLHAVAVFNAVLTVWRNDVEARGGTFLVVLLPVQLNRIFHRYIRGEYEVVDLFEDLSRRFPAFQVEREVLLRSIPYLSEAGNYLVASLLYETFAALLGLTPGSPAWVEERLRVYYQAFADRPYAWLPKGTVGVEGADPAKVEALRERYLQLELRLEHGKR
ncbi:MAG: hypothetical protein A2284_09765 [Deltaproteobacteria bacterium RIFOXYA12_FULL_61_11]|nr:MAG: hypothetical protein A2284_09765 [Deltaproteobacteria bacterium RIFOXYA12_FULL_61_11]